LQQIDARRNGEDIGGKAVQKAAMTAEPAPPERTPWGLVILLGSLTAMGPVAIDMYLPSLPAIGVGLHASPGEAQATVSAFLAGMAVGAALLRPGVGPAGTQAADPLGHGDLCDRVHRLRPGGLPGHADRRPVRPGARRLRRRRGCPAR